MVTDNQTRLVILVVEGERADYATLAGALGSDDLVLATSVEEARDRLASANPSAMFVSVPLDDGAAALVEDVRADRFGHPGLPIVVVVDGDADRAAALGVDETVAVPVTVAEVESAVERAALLGRYKLAVDEFFDACRTRAEGAGGDLPRSARRAADEYLQEIQARGDPIPFESLIEGV